MNNQETTTTVEISSMSPFAYDALKPRRQAFVRFLVERGSTHPMFCRDELLRHSIDFGLGSPPAWIVRDSARRLNRGMYEIPEITDFISKNFDKI